mmetsp:Transcript_31877/g.74536  ORF Transcript_31877/g.74536 Transcript_31877/m.74536 type:complete len:539 (+) Transcript_31877:66-1682(+)
MKPEVVCSPVSSRSTGSDPGDSAADRIGSPHENALSLLADAQELRQQRETTLRSVLLRLRGYSSVVRAPQRLSSIPAESESGEQETEELGASELLEVDPCPAAPASSQAANDGEAPGKVQQRAEDLTRLMTWVAVACAGALGQDAISQLSSCGPPDGEDFGEGLKRMVVHMIGLLEKRAITDTSVQSKTPGSSPVRKASSAQQPFRSPASKENHSAKWWQSDCDEVQRLRSELATAEQTLHRKETSSAARIAFLEHRLETEEQCLADLRKEAGIDAAEMQARQAKVDEAKRVMVHEAMEEQATNLRSAYEAESLHLRSRLTQEEQAAVAACKSAAHLENQLHIADRDLQDALSWRHVLSQGNTSCLRRADAPVDAAESLRSELRQELEKEMRSQAVLEVKQDVLCNPDSALRRQLRRELRRELRDQLRSELASLTHRGSKGERHLLQTPLLTVPPRHVAGRSPIGEASEDCGVTSSMSSASSSPYFSPESRSFRTPGTATLQPDLATRASPSDAIDNLVEVGCRLSREYPKTWSMMCQ